MPSVFKLSIGFVQVEVILELIIRVRESNRIENLHKRSITQPIEETEAPFNAQLFINKMITGQKRSDLLVNIFRIVTLALIAISIILATVFFCIKDVTLSKKDRS